MPPEEVELARLLRQAGVGTLHYLMHGNASIELAAAETEFHHGDDPIEADKEAQRYFEQAARDHPGFEDWRIIAIVGEESIKDIGSPPAGDRVIVVDPLDGSKPWAYMRTGYCVAALLLRSAGGGRWIVECALIALPGEAFTLLSQGLLLHGPLDGEPESDLVIASVVPEAPELSRCLAAVAYKPEDRATALPIANQLSTWAFITLGGNPMVPYVLTGSLTAIITLKPTSTWDSVGTLMAASTDAVVGDHEGNLLSGPDFRELFAQVLLTGNVTPIPKLIVAKSHDAYLEVVGAIARSRTDRRTWEERRSGKDRRTAIDLIDATGRWEEKRTGPPDRRGVLKS